MSLTRNQIIVIGVAGLLILILILIFAGILPGLKEEDPRFNIRTNLEFWGVFDNVEAYNAALAAYKETYPGVVVNYRRFASVADYERALLDALAAGQGPDVFMLHSRDLPRDVNKLAPVAAAKFTILGLRNLFPQVVESDFVSKGAIYALPLSIDTLALYYNRQHFDQAAITSPPKTWEEFEAALPKLKGVAIENAPDIVSLLMLQSGTAMVNDSFTRATFDSREGEDALNFYVKFAEPESPVALDTFAEGEVSMTFNYASAASRVRAKAPSLNFAVSDAPQPQRAQAAIAYPDYWGYAVSRQSRKQNLAWDFILALTANRNNAKFYIDRTGRPPALRSMIDEKLNDPVLNVFARQALIARSWPQADPDEVSKIFSEMVRSVISGGESVSEALDAAEKEVTRLMERRL
ncbi:MAG: extracellular solute-binding protein [Candidatus Brennerbacteria bacterium]|nr:extracellular solute-binding protein [Candidatus Brennerbacteria bacterium]